MTDAATNHSAGPPRDMGVPATLTIAAVVVSALRAGSLIGLVPHLWQTGGLSWPFTVLLMHVAGALFTVAAAVAHSRTGLLIAVLYTGYSTVILGLDAPTMPLQILVWMLGGLTLLLVLGASVFVKAPDQRARQSRCLLMGAMALVLGVVIMILLRH